MTEAPTTTTLPTVEEIAQVIEHAMHYVEWTVGKKPSIDELEKILNSDYAPRVVILPDGSITAGEPRDEAVKAAKAIHALLTKAPTTATPTKVGDPVTREYALRAASAVYLECPEPVSR